MWLLSIAQKLASSSATPREAAGFGMPAPSPPVSATTRAPARVDANSSFKSGIVSDVLGIQDIPGRVHA
jgi:hypothetical protein